MAEEKMPVNLRYLKNGTWNSMELQPVISLRSNDDWKEVMGDKDLYNLLAYYLKSGIENQVRNFCFIRFRKKGNVLAFSGEEDFAVVETILYGRRRR